MNDDEGVQDLSHGGCGGCTLGAASRREFLGDAVRAAAAALVALGAAPRGLRALEVGFASGERSAAASVSYATPTADGATIDRANEVILVRFEGSVYAFALSCPHQNTALRWDPSGARFQCPKHKSRYRLDGTFVSGRATRSMDRYAIRQGPGGVAVDLGTVYREDQDPAGWKAAVMRV